MTLVVSCKQHGELARITSNVNYDDVRVGKAAGGIAEAHREAHYNIQQCKIDIRIASDWDERR